MAGKKLLFVCLAALSLLGLSAIGYILLDQLGCEGQVLNYPYYMTSGEGQEIWGDRIIGQSFVASQPQLNRIDLKFHTYNRRNTGIVTLRLIEVSDGLANPLMGLEVFKTSFKAASVAENTWQTFRFHPIAASAGKTYLITLQSPDSQKGNAISLGGIVQDAYVPGSAFAGPIPIPEADIAFRSCYIMGNREKLQVLSEQLTHHRPAFWGYPAFYLISALIYLIILIVFLWKFITFMMA